MKILLNPDLTLRLNLETFPNYKIKKIKNSEKNSKDNSKKQKEEKVSVPSTTPNTPSKTIKVATDPQPTSSGNTPLP